MADKCSYCKTEHPNGRPIPSSHSNMNAAEWHEIAYCLANRAHCAEAQLTTANARIAELEVELCSQQSIVPWVLRQTNR